MKIYYTYKKQRCVVATTLENGADLLAMFIINPNTQIRRIVC